MFDYQSAIKAGASEDQILEYLNKTRGYDVQGALRAGASKQQVIDYLSKTSINKQEPKKKSTLEKVADFGTGIIKGGIESLTGLASLGEKAVLGTYKTLLPKSAEEKLGLDKERVAGSEFLQKLKTPETDIQKAGKLTEQVGEFLIPAGGQAKAYGYLARKLPQANKALQLTARGVGEGLEFAGKTAIQTRDLEESIKAALFGAFTPLASKVVGVAGEAITQKLPEKLYSQIFKVAEDDLRLMYETITKGQKLNPTLAREMLERNVKGSSKNMAIYSFKKLQELEQKLQTFVTNTKAPMALNNKNDYLNLLNNIKKNFDKSFFSDRLNTVNSLIKEFNSVKGKSVNMETALKARRFFDSIRNTSSFRLDPTLSRTQEELKIAADMLRKELAKNPIFKDIINEERVFIQAFDAIIDDAVKRKNKVLLGLTDVLLGGGGLAAGAGVGGVGLAGLVRGFQQPFTLTNLGQMFKKGEKLINPQTINTSLRGAGRGLLEMFKKD